MWKNGSRTSWTGPRLTHAPLCVPVCGVSAAATSLPSCRTMYPELRHTQTLYVYENIKVTHRDFNGTVTKLQHRFKPHQWSFFIMTYFTETTVVLLLRLTAFAESWHPHTVTGFPALYKWPRPSWPCTNTEGGHIRSGNVHWMNRSKINLLRDSMSENMNHLKLSEKIKEKGMRSNIYW